MGDPHDRGVWSGTPYFALKEVQRRFDDVYVVDTRRIDKLVNFLNRRTRRLGWDLVREPFIVQLYARAVKRSLEIIKPDAVISVGASHKLCSIDCDRPIVHISDALFETITAYYQRFQRILDRSRSQGNRIQQALIDRSHAILLTSDWARRSAEEFYNVPPGRIKVAPIGANLDADPGAGVIKITKDRLRLLFIGIAWQRKGGGLLLQVFDLIRSREPEAELHIVGCSPDEAVGVPGVMVHGYLRKNDLAQGAQLSKLLDRAAMFAMLSLEEAFGLVYCEAAAYALPCVGLRTGGVPTIVRDGESGLLFDPGTPPSKIASDVVMLWRDKARYDAMRVAAREQYETRLNWAAWGDAVERELRPVRSGDGGSRSFPDQQP
jgi:glycosyltransferase involved in cell wall biosynthesis